MTRYRIRLNEQSIVKGSGDFTVDADPPELAAAILLKAHETARDASSNVVVLANGQSRHIEPREVVENNVFCIQLDEDGDEIGGEIKPNDGPSPLNMKSQDSAGPSGTEPWPW